MDIVSSVVSALNACRKDAGVAKSGLDFLAGLAEMAGNQVMLRERGFEV